MLSPESAAHQLLVGRDSPHVPLNDISHAACILSSKEVVLEREGDSRTIDVIDPNKQRGVGSGMTHEVIEEAVILSDVETVGTVVRASAKHYIFLSCGSGYRWLRDERDTVHPDE